MRLQCFLCVIATEAVLYTTARKDSVMNCELLKCLLEPPWHRGGRTLCRALARRGWMRRGREREEREKSGGNNRAVAFGTRA